MKKTLLSALLFSGFTLTAQTQNVGIGTTTPNSNAILDLTSTNKGLLLPRVALTGTANAAPMTAHTAGLTVYNTATAGDVTPGTYLNNGTKWVRVADANANEWVYNPTNSQINLKRVADSSGLQIYYKPDNGKFINFDTTTLYTDAFRNDLNVFTVDTFNTNGAVNFFTRNSKNIQPKIFSWEGINYTGKSLGRSIHYVQEPNTLTNFSAYANVSGVTTSRTNNTPTNFLEGGSFFVTKLDNNNTNYVVGGSVGSNIHDGNIPGYATATRSEIYANTPGTINLMSSYLGFTTIGRRQTGLIQDMVGISSGLNFIGTSATINHAAGLRSHANFALMDTGIATITNLYGYVYSGINNSNGASTMPSVSNHFGIYLNDVNKANNNWAIFTNKGRVSLGDTLQLRNINNPEFSSTDSNDKVLVSDANGNVKIKSTNSIAAGSNVWRNIETNQMATTNTENIKHAAGKILLGSDTVPNMFKIPVGFTNSGSEINMYTKTIYPPSFGTGFGMEGFSTFSGAGLSLLGRQLGGSGNLSPSINLGYFDSTGTGYTHNSGDRGTITRYDSIASPAIKSSMIIFNQVQGKVTGSIVIGRNGDIVFHNDTINTITSSLSSYSGMLNNSKLVIKNNGNVGIGSPANIDTIKLHVAGNIKSDGKVYANQFVAGTSTFPDYVFEAYYNGSSDMNPSYRFSSLDETESFIKEKGHLPGFTPAKEVIKSGSFDMTKTAITSVEKIEELYLHVIGLEKRVKELEKENAILKSKK